MSIVRTSTVRRLSMALLLGMLITLFGFSSAPSVSAHNGHPHQLRLVSLHCWETEDQTFDEAYLKVGGNKVWGTMPMSRGSNLNLSAVPPQLFVDSVTIKLYDEDGGLFDYDDRLGRVTIPASQAGTGNHTVWFLDDDDAVYSLTYRVI
jgi:hypothetical protein